MKKTLLSILFAVGVFVVPYLCIGIFAIVSLSMIGIRDASEMKQALRPYDGATYFFEETAYIRTDASQTTVYYWSADPLEKVKASYEKTGLKFLPGTNSLDWWITAYNKDGLPQALPTSTNGISDHQSICIVKEFGCISITLVKADRPRLCTLSAVFPGNRWYPLTKLTPYENCSRFPKQGTLIIFNYYLEEM
jgi:hypothetical protein